MSIQCTKDYSINVTGPVGPDAPGPFQVDGAAIAAMDNNYHETYSGSLVRTSPSTYVEGTGTGSIVLTTSGFGFYNLTFTVLGFPITYCADSGSATDPRGSYSWCGGFGMYGYPPAQITIS